MSNWRTRIIELIEAEGPADIKSLADRLNHNPDNIRQILKRMVADGQLETFKNAPRTYITTDLSLR
jgi:predicted ArsR family transcriptional regulator